jgi:hypothetical protein
LYSTAFESCGALRHEKDRREALRFPALRNRRHSRAHRSFIEIESTGARENGSAYRTLRVRKNY